MHDVNGKPLKVGDEVVLRAKITHLSEGSLLYCNVTIEAVHPMPVGVDAKGEPAFRKESFASVNTKMLEKVEPTLTGQDIDVAHA